MPSSGLKKKPQQILNFIVSFGDERRYPPTVRDIQQACNISSTSVVNYNLNVLEREGYIRRDKEVSRGIEVLGSTANSNGQPCIPILGYIAAGEPIPVPDADSYEPMDYIEVSDTFLKQIREQLYALRVKGLSMIDALVDDGDIVVIQPLDNVRDGDMIVAWLQSEQEVTLKRFYKEGDLIRLQPANSTMGPIYVDADNLAIQGKVVAVLRGGM
mgnify:FL=1